MTNHNYGAFSLQDVEGRMVVTTTTDLESLRYGDIHADTNRVLATLRQSRPADVVIDLGAVEFLNSSQISVFVKIARGASLFGADVCFCGESQTVKDVFESMNLTKLWPHHDTLKTAIEHAA
jgi:anti-anti-sigma factor